MLFCVCVWSGVFYICVFYMWFVIVVLIVLLVFIQYFLWWGYGGWLWVYELCQQFDDQFQKNVDEKLCNECMVGEVQDLQSGIVVIEECVCYEMGMVKDGEVFVQFVLLNVFVGLVNNMLLNMLMCGVVFVVLVWVVLNLQLIVKLLWYYGGDKGKVVYY